MKFGNKVSLPDSTIAAVLKVTVTYQTKERNQKYKNGREGA